MKIYTKTGDGGETSLFTGKRVPKDNPFIEALGAVDECNSAIGVAISFLGNSPELLKVKEQLETVQHALFDVGATLATPERGSATFKLAKTRFDSEETAALESWLDAMEEKLPVLHAFILPGGHSSGAMLHLARSLCRRAERAVIPLHKEGDVPMNVLVYLNRLSDYLFVASRYVNQLMSVPETKWEHHKLIAKH